MEEIALLPVLLKKCRAEFLLIRMIIKTGRWQETGKEISETCALPVGASLLAMAVDQSPSMLKVLALSRAGSLLQV
ncbi:hypothetical protein [Pseudomonas sp. C2B4]|uniref:hypothetical protein n=1 Tax=Pseudomonas sp. C2B4 TaxID=2735270 RepID=UPI0015868F4E|nr:hypothetical protein [Pseudomonas sp. C2B4]NUU37573.1 hypothetical protein [Pseudomonas sp. C2B4]